MVQIAGADSNGQIYPIRVDSSGRPYVILDDGAGNTQPAGDAVGRPIFVKVTDGAQVWEIDASSRGVVAVAVMRPDGANIMPSGDTTARSIFTRLTDGTTDAVIDPETGALTQSRAIHRRILQSNMWMASYRKVELDIATSFHIHIKTHSTKNMHVIYDVFVEGKSQIYLTEDPTLTNDGTELTEYNFNRQTPTASTGTIYRDPAITAVGTIIETSEIGQVGHFTAAGGTMDNGGYWMLEKDESYIIWVYNDSGAVSDVVVKIIWHEE